MSLVELLLAAEAAEAGRAVRRTAYRHVHLADRPLVVVAYNLSGEAAAPLGVMCGTDPDPSSASLAVSAEPRNRESRFAAIDSFAADFTEFVRPFLELTTVPKRGGGFRQVAEDAPQVVVPNRGTRAFLGSLALGRSLRYLGLGDTHEVPEKTQWTGSHLSWLAEHSHLPGQSAFLAMTETLSQHFVTGQSALEDENLATLLAWIDGVPGDLLPELERLEDQAYGPVPNPRWEARLEPFVKAYSVGLREDDDAKAQAAFVRIESEVRDALSVAYAATHRAINMMRSIDPARSVSKRWAIDLNDWAFHAMRSGNGIPRFARRHSPIRAARALQRWSSAQEDLETDQAFDDPMVLADLDAAGRCITGNVAMLDPNNKEVKPGNQRASRVPIVEVSLTALTRLLAGEVVRCTADIRVRGVVRAVDGATALIAVMAGAKALDDTGLASGDVVVFVGLDPWGGRDPLAPADVPWTHREASTSGLAGEGEVEADAGATDDSPDMTLAELAGVTVVGVVGPDAEPGGAAVTRRPGFVEINKRFTDAVVADIGRAEKDEAVLVEAPPGAGKSTLAVSVSNELVSHDSSLRLPIVTQTNEQADDLVMSLRRKHREIVVARLHGGSGPSRRMVEAADTNLVLSSDHDDSDVLDARVVVATARKWEFVRSKQQGNNDIRKYEIALIDEAYQMRSDALLGIADLFERLMCVGDPGQLDPFTTIDDALWKGLQYAPSRTAMGTLRAYHPELDAHQLPTSWRLPPSAAGIVSEAFYPFSGFGAGIVDSQRQLLLGPGGASADDEALDRLADDGWGYVELPEKLTVRTDTEIASRLARLVKRLLKRGGTVVDELDQDGSELTPSDLAVIAAHNDQVHAVRYALDECGVAPDSVVVSTANKIQGREYEVVLVWHPLAGRRDATAFHLEAGRMCVMLSRHRHACLVVGRAGADRLLAEFPDADPVFLDEPEKFPDGWEANSQVLEHLSGFKVS